MSLPRKGEGFWEWRFTWEQVQPQHAARRIPAPLEYVGATRCPPAAPPPSPGKPAKRHAGFGHLVRGRLAVDAVGPRSGVGDDRARGQLHVGDGLESRFKPIKIA